MTKKAVKIEIEGTDGAGKTTGLKYLLEKLQQADQKVLETRDVGNPHIPVCVELRKLVLDPKSNLCGESMEFIFAAMRLENDKFYKKVGDDYDFILSDRGWFTHLAYTDHNVSLDFTDNFYGNIVAPLTNLPDVVVYFQVDGKTALGRRVRRGEEADVIELKGEEYQEKVRESFSLRMEQEDGLLVFNIDATQDLEGVKKQLDDVAQSLLKLKQS
jgi:dTMP kinase